MKPTPTRTNTTSQVSKRLALATAVLSLIVPFGAEAAARTNSPYGVATANRVPRVAPFWVQSGTNINNRASFRASNTNWNSLTGAASTPTRPAAERIIPDEVGPNHRSWKVSEDSPSAATNRFGLSRSAKPGVVEMATGINYWDGTRWSPSVASFELTDDAFVAKRVQHQTRLNADLNVVGAVTTTLKDGTTLRSTPVAIALYDPTDGRFAVISTITNTVGVLVASNQVVYPGAFAGGVCADVVYTLQNGSFEQDVVITGRLNPLDYGFPTNSQIQILTEFYDPPQPEKMRRPIYVEQKEIVRRRKVSPDLMDDVLGFGELVIGTGRAFTPPTALHTNGTQTVVAKEFRAIPEEGRTFLIETINCLSVQKALNGLPECAEGKRTAQYIRNSNGRDGYAFIGRPSGMTPTGTKPQRSPMRLAKAMRENPRGVVIDYIATVNSGTTVFKADTTYWVSGPVYFYGPVTIEGGAVIKYPNSTGTDLLGNTTTAFIQLNGTLTCKTSSYRPAIFTAGDDDSVGESLNGYWWGYTGSIGTKSYANPALYSYWLSSPTMSNVRFCYAQEAVRLEGSYVSGTLSHAQLVKCVRGIVLVSAEDGSGSGSGSGGTSVTVTVNNGLFAFVQTALAASSYGSGSGSGSGGYGGGFLYQCTVDNASHLTDADANWNVTFKNCILANSGLWNNANLSASTYNGFYNCPAFGTSVNRWIIPAYDPSPFESSGAGSYYLKTDDTRFRGKGTQTIGTALLNSLKTRTTQLPLAFPRWMEVTGELTLFPRAARYVSGPPDLGYYYDALDYTVAAMLLEGAAITVEPGTAVAVRNDSYIWYDEFNQPWAAFTTWGFIMYDGSSFVSRGSPPTPNIFTTVELVQDGTSVQPGGAPFGKWPGVPCRAELFNITGNEPEPVLDFRFSNFSLPSAWCYHFITGNNFNRPQYVSWINKSALRLTLRDCNLTSGQIDLGYSGFDANGGLYPGVANLDWQNNLFDRVSMNLDPAFAPESPSVDFAFRAQNNLFRGGLLTLIPTPAPTIHWYLPGIVNLPQLAAALLAQADPVSVYLYGRLSTDTQTLLVNYGGGDDWVLQSALAQELSAIILGVSIYDATRFAGVTLRQETLDLLALNPTGSYLARLNRMLLEDAFPGDLLSMSLSLWTFKDNLFDKVAFEQYQITPVDQDFNAYWKRLPAELETWETDRLYPDAANDRVLTATPAYQTGPLGDYYLATSSPLYNSDKRGSRSVTDAGLYHYTTQTSQTKDGALSGNVVIGRHYVATASSSSTQPKDSETPTGDGVPDYVEDANGNGQCDSTTETRTDLTSTDGIVTDCLNSVYDDIDLSGNGLVGRIKKALNLSPLSSINPLVAVRLTTGEEPDIATFEVPLSYDAVTNTGNLDLRVNGESATLLDVERATNGNCLIVLNTTYETPGKSYLQTALLVNDAPDDTSITVGAGNLIIFDSGNIVQFFEAYSAFSDAGAILYAQTPDYPDANYAIELKTPEGDHIRTLTGAAFAGEILVNWDLTYDDGVTPYTGEDVDAVFEAALPDGGTKKSKQKLKKVTTVTDGKFNVAYMYNCDSAYLDRDGMFWWKMNGVVDKLLAPRNIYPNLYESGFNWFWEAFNPGYPGYVPDRTKALTLRTSLAVVDTKNFFYYGHGGGTRISDGTANANKAYLDASEVAKALTNNFSAKGGFAVKHPYRFVWLDGCSTGSSKAWRHAFGIYSKGAEGQGVAGIVGPQAFVGWKKEVTGLGATHATAITCKDYGDMLNLFFDKWMRRQTLSQCIAAASSKSLYLPLPIKGNENVTLSDGTKYTRSTADLYIIGYTDLKRD